MFYVRERLTDSVKVKISLDDENVYCTCPGCGTEFSVDLSQVFADGEGDMHSTSIYCADCTKKMLKEVRK